jgi:hypothetical protein
MRASVSFVPVLLLVFACEEKKIAPPTVATETKPETPTESTLPKLEARPPGWVPPADAGAAAPPEAKTGICSFQENSFDGQDTRSNEKMVVRVKEDKIVAAEYRYRGSYALDGKSESLNVPTKPNDWVEFELPMTSGTKTFKVRLKGTDMDLKGTAAADASASCVWKMEDQDEDPDVDGGKQKADKKKKTR